MREYEYEILYAQDVILLYSPRHNKVTLQPAALPGEGRVEVHALHQGVQLDRCLSKISQKEAQLSIFYGEGLRVGKISSK